LTADYAAWIAAESVAFAIRYLTLDAHEADTDLTRAEALDILGAGLPLMAIQHAAPSGWVPSAALGTEYGGWAAANAQLVGLPPGVSIWLNLAGVATGTSDNAVIAYCNAWYAPVAAAGYTPGLYVGAGVPADNAWLAELPFKLFWLSDADMPIPPQGYCLYQSGPYSLRGFVYHADEVTDAENPPFVLAPAAPGQP
jgi:hypothetical protein